MAQSRADPPPVPPRVDLGETEENLLDSQDHVAPSPPQTSMFEPAVKPVAVPKSLISPPNLSKHASAVPAVTEKTTKPEPKKDAKGRPLISIISARPMDQNNSVPVVKFTNDNGEVSSQERHVDSNQPAANAEVRSQGNRRKQAPIAPKKLPNKLEDRHAKPAETSSKKLGPAPNLRPKAHASKRSSGSVFYTDTSTDIDQTPSSTPVISNVSDKHLQKSKQVASQATVKSKPALPVSRKPKTKGELKAVEISPVVNAKVNPPDKTVSKPKLRPTIITAKTPKQHGQIDSTDPPSRPSFPPNATADELNKQESQPERPKAPPNTEKDEQIQLEVKLGQKNEKNEQSGKKGPKSKPTRPPMVKESGRLKPSRPPSAKPNVTRKSSSKTRLSTSERTVGIKPAPVKPTGPPRAQAKFDYTGGTEDDLPFKAGETIMLTSKIDDNWLVGYLENDVMHQGLFPTSFVEIIVALKEHPDTETSKKKVPSGPYAIAIYDFQGQSNQAELSFSSGETIILLERINNDWLKGQSNDSIGIFPASFVQIEHDLPLATKNIETAIDNGHTSKTKAKGDQWCEAVHDYQGEHTDDLSFTAGTKIMIIERLGDDWFKGECSGKRGIFPASFVQILSDVNGKSQDFFVTAIHDYSSENREDLSFKSGDEIKIVERINADWLMGECNGKRGLFPASFVQDGQLGSSPVGKAANGKNGQTKDCGMAKAIHEFTGENPGELNFKAGDVIQVLRFVDDNWSEGRINDMCGIFPTAFVEIQPLVATKEVYAKALYDFAGESEQDLAFKAGDTIQVLEQVNDDWCSGCIDGRTGHFPSSFVKIV